MFYQTCLALKTDLSGSCHHCPHFTSESTEAQRDEGKHLTLAWRIAQVGGKFKVTSFSVITLLGPINLHLT